MHDSLIEAVKNNDDDLPIWKVEFNGETKFVSAASAYRASRLLFDSIHGNTERVRQKDVYAALVENLKK